MDYADLVAMKERYGIDDDQELRLQKLHDLLEPYYLQPTKHLTKEAKYAIIKRLKAGDDEFIIAEDLGVSSNTVTTIKKVLEDKNKL